MDSSRFSLPRFVPAVVLASLGLICVAASVHAGIVGKPTEYRWCGH